MFDGVKPMIDNGGTAGASNSAGDIAVSIEGACTFPSVVALPADSLHVNNHAGTYVRVTTAVVEVLR